MRITGPRTGREWFEVAAAAPTARYRIAVLVFPRTCRRPLASVRAVFPVTPCWGFGSRCGQCSRYKALPMLLASHARRSPRHGLISLCTPKASALVLNRAAPQPARGRPAVGQIGNWPTCGCVQPGPRRPNNQGGW